MTFFSLFYEHAASKMTLMPAVRAGYHSIIQFICTELVYYLKLRVDESMELAPAPLWEVQLDSWRSEVADRGLLERSLFFCIAWACSCLLLDPAILNQASFTFSRCHCDLSKSHLGYPKIKRRPSISI